MARLVVVHTEPILEKFHAPRCSIANFWRFLSTFLTVALSLLLCFFSQGLWRQTNTFLEKPIVHFTENTLFLFESSTHPKKIFFWSPIGKLNEIGADKFELIVPIIETTQNDWDEDWRADDIEIRVAFRRANTNASSTPLPLNFTSCYYALFFDVKLEKRTLVELKGAPIFGGIQTQNAFNEINIIGTMDFLQQNLLPYFGNLSFDQWNPQLAGNLLSEEFLSEISPMEINWQMRNWAVGQNYSIELGRKIERTQLTIQRDDIIFYLTFHVRISEQVLHYRTNGWEMIKWAWIQYLAFFIIVRYLIDTLSSFLYQNQVIGTFLDGIKNKIH